MSNVYPPEYEECRAFLLGWRKELLETLILGRLRRLATEYARTIERIRNIVINFPIEFAMKQMIQRYYLVGSLYGRTLEGFSSVSAKLSYVGKTTTYPKEKPVAEVMELPSVPMMLYTPLEEYELHEKITDSILLSYAIVRAPKDMFKETPDFVNAMYNYYKFEKSTVISGEWDVHNPYPVVSEGKTIYVQEIRGQVQKVHRTLTRKSDNKQFTIRVNVWTDCIVKWSDGSESNVAIVLEIKCEPEPNTYLCDVMVLRRVFRIPNDLGVYEVLRYADRLIGVRFIGERTTSR